MQTSMMPPKLCPNCGRLGMLVAFGYYERYVAGLGTKDLLLSIRRFRCRACARSVRVLPDFAQPYGVIRNSVIADFFNGDVDRDGVQQQRGLLIVYWRRFVWWLPNLRRAIGRSFGRSPLAMAPRTWWDSSSRLPVICGCHAAARGRNANHDLWSILLPSAFLGGVTSTDLIYSAARLPMRRSFRDRCVT